ncbi:MAG: ion channel, partial [Bryobacteraceae bacterium]
MTPVEEPKGDLGFGQRVAERSRQRLLNRDGSFNVRRLGLTRFSAASLYHWLLTLSWTRFLLLTMAAYVAINALFAVAYLACGPGALE